jgi:hypothetical protein
MECAERPVGIETVVPILIRSDSAGQNDHRYKPEPYHLRPGRKLMS